MRCPACHTPVSTPGSNFRPYADYECVVYDCAECGSRFTAHHESMHERLHASPGSSYQSQRQLGQAAATWFAVGDVASLRRILASSPKYEFVIDAVESRADVRRVLEVGCSKGYLSAYLITRGFDVLGTDISPSAVAEATSLFGPHFVEAGSPAIPQRQPYDAIVHVGTVGCVADPVAFTRELLGLLRPGGRLIFNAPNADACRGTGEVWGASTPPPDLVTLFTPHYWHRYADVADVDVQVTDVEPSAVLKARLRRWRRDRPPVRKLLEAEMKPRQPDDWRSRPVASRVAATLARGLASLRVLPRQPAEFGVHVVMTKH